MNVALPPDLERFVKDKVARIGALRREIAVGDEQLARGETREFDLGAIKRRGREALAKRADLPKSE